MILAASLLTSITPALYTWWRFAGWYAWSMAEKDPTHRDNSRQWNYPLVYGKPSKKWHPSADIWVGGYFLGFWVGLAWPLVVIALVFRKVTRIDQGTLNYVPRQTRMRLQAERIKELERQAGIR